MSNSPKPRNNRTGKFTKTSNPKSERMYLTINEKLLIEWLRNEGVNLRSPIDTLKAVVKFKDGITVSKKNSS